MVRSPPPLQLVFPLYKVSVTDSAKIINAAYLFIKMQNKHNDRQQRRTHHNRKSDPWNPLPRPQKQLPLPCRTIFAAICWRQDYHFGIRDDALHADKVLLIVFRGSDEELFDIVICTTKAEEGVWRQ
jgi:hypothetical protein